MRTLEIINCEVISYADALEMQNNYFNTILDTKKHKSASVPTDQGSESNEIGVIMLCEHPHVYTLGKSGSINNMLVDSDFLKSIDAEYFKTDRGGDITYHGYGQLVGYPIIDLEKLGVSLKEYIHILEEAVIRTIAKWGIVGSRLEGATGVWIDEKRKICAIGVKASRYVTMHGFALNVNTDLKYFDYINPCGFTDKGVTSISKEIGRDIDMGDVKKYFLEEFENIILHRG